MNKHSFSEILAMKITNEGITAEQLAKINIDEVVKEVGERLNGVISIKKDDKIIYKLE